MPRESSNVSIRLTEEEARLIKRVALERGYPGYPRGWTVFMRELVLRSCRSSEYRHKKRRLLAELRNLEARPRKSNEDKDRIAKIREELDL